MPENTLTLTALTQELQKTALPARLTLSSAEFVAGFVPPDYLIVGWLQRRFVYSLTAATGDGKTAVALLITLLVSQGFKLGKLSVKRGRVLYFAGENPDDVRMRWMATTQQFALTPEDIDNVHFVPGVFKFTEISERIHQEMAARELALVIVDTSASYFETDDENNNMQALAHAKRLRELSRLPGGPTVLICCHPTKNAESLVPRGGGAFLNEVDGNLTCKRDDLAVELHWCGKFRGPDFAPMFFQLKVVTHESLKDTEGNLIQTVVALSLSDEGLRDMSARTRADEDQVLLSVDENPRLSFRDRAQQLGWRMRSGDPNHTRVLRAAKALVKAKLIIKTRDACELTKQGKKEVANIKARAPGWNACSSSNDQVGTTH
jgi:AAA domain